MANTTINVQPYFIQGDGVSTTAVINLGIVAGIQTTDQLSNITLMVEQTVI